MLPSECSTISAFIYIPTSPDISIFRFCSNTLLLDVWIIPRWLSVLGDTTINLSQRGAIICVIISNAEWDPAYTVIGWTVSKQKSLSHGISKEWSKVRLMLKNRDRNSPVWLFIILHNLSLPTHNSTMQINYSN